MMHDAFIYPDWPVPANVKAVSTVRYPIQGEHFSDGVYRGLNLGDHVGDQSRQVAANRQWLAQQLELPAEPCWLSQVHGNRVVNIACARSGEEADGAVAFRSGVCAIMTADCLPVLLADQRGRCIAAAHAGWRGLADGVLENSIAAMNEAPHKIFAWLGPAIGPSAFEVGSDVVEAFVSQQPMAEQCFSQTDEQHWLADIYQLARLRLSAAGVRHIYGGDECTLSDESRFYSYRRDGQTGRMASLIWFDQG